MTNEVVKNIDDIDSVVENQIVGKPEFTNSSITFKGTNNILYCESDVKLNNSNITFQGNNSIIYLSSSKHDYCVNIFAFYNNTIFFGKDNNIDATLNVNVQEAQNVIIGDKCIFGSNVSIRTSDSFPTFAFDSKRRINLPSSVFIGDHVWLAHQAYISRGVKLGSGSIIFDNATVFPKTIVPSNSFYAGNPAVNIADGVFFTDVYTDYFDEEKTKKHEFYKSDDYEYEVTKKETISLDYVDKILKEFPLEERLEFIQKLLVNSKGKNRFAIK